MNEYIVNKRKALGKDSALMCIGVIHIQLYIKNETRFEQQTLEWSQVLKSPLVRNCILLFSLLLILLVGLFSYAVYKQYLQLKMKTDIGVL